MDAQPSPAGTTVPSIETIEAELKELSIESSQADWVYSTYITSDTEALAARAFARLLNEAARYTRLLGPTPRAGAGADEVRKGRLLKLLLPVCSPNDPKDAEVLARTIADLQGIYAKGRFRPA